MTVFALTILLFASIFLIYLRKGKIKQNLLDKPASTTYSSIQSASAYPRYWGTFEGEIIKAIVSSERPLSWKEIQRQTNFDIETLNKALSNLFADNAITKLENMEETLYKIPYDLFKSYKIQLRLITSTERKKELEDWINQWKELRKIDLSLDYDHFFLEGRHLDDFSKELISHAKLNVVVVNPFIQDCDLSNTLRDIKKKGIKVQIITRQPQDKNPEYLKKKKEYMSRFETEGITCIYNNKVHAKIIIVDNSVAIVSSMNFYPESSAGALWEAGLISINSKIIESILGSLKAKIE